MHKPLRRMHTSTERFPFSRRSPSKRRAFLGVFNITKSIGDHDKGQRQRISLQIKCCRPITPPIIREKHRRARIFARASVCRGLRLQNTRKNARRHHPHMARSKTKARPKRPRAIFIQIYFARDGSAEVTQARGRPSFPAHSAGRKNPRRTLNCAPILGRANKRPTPHIVTDSGSPPGSVPSV